LLSNGKLFAKLQMLSCRLTTSGAVQHSIASTRSVVLPRTFDIWRGCLGQNKRLYGIQAPTDKRNAEFVSSIKSISQHYVDELVKFQPEGSFFWVVTQ
jgi:hypothetical protein